MTIAWENEWVHPAVHGRLYPAKLVLPGSPVAVPRMNMGVDESWWGRGMPRIDTSIRARDVAVALTTHRRDATAFDDHGVSVQNRIGDVAREHQAHIGDD